MDAMVIGVVPARLGSTRFPGKVLEVVAGKPLVVHAFERLRAARSVAEALVATDSAEVERVAAAHGAPVVRVDVPCDTGTDRVARALAKRSFDIAVNLQADQPAIDPHEIDRTVAALLSDPTLDVSTLAYEDDDPEAFGSRDVVKVVAGAAGRALYFSRAAIPSSKSADSGNTLFLHHVGIYCFRRAALLRFAGMPRGALELRESLEQLRALEGGMSMGLVVADRAMPEVDRRSDLRRVEGLLGST
jgi:3-deoxy-manno-octulosonate cytidylyltransferase (CMP-KDO synthetase)